MNSIGWFWVGANTAIFSMVNGFLLRPLPVPSPERLVVLAIDEKGSPLGASGFSYPTFTEFRKQAKPLCEVFGQALVGGVGLSADGRTDEISLTAVTGNYFSGLGVKPSLGRLILPGEGEKPGEEPVAVLGFSYWQRRFGRDAEVVGKGVRIDGIPMTIVGVVPHDFRGSFSAFEMDAYVPFSTLVRDQAWSGFWADRRLRAILAMGRLKSGAGIAEAQSGFDVISDRIAAQYPATDKGLAVRLVPEREARPIPYANNAFILISALFLALAALVLLVACTNVANLLLARAAVRQREMAIRTALGANRWRLIRQTHTETFLLALFGAMGGLVFAAWVNWLIGSMRSIHQPDLPLQLDSNLDWRVFSFAVAAMVVAGVLLGASPASRAAGADVNAVLHRGGRSGGARSRHRVPGGLMVAQVAGSLALLIIAGLFVRSLQFAKRIHLGFNPDSILNVTLDPRESNYTEVETNQFYRHLEAKVGSLPGVQSVSFASFVPIESYPAKQSVYVESGPLPPGQQVPAVLFNSVDDAYFRTMQIPLMQGREFMQSDNETAPPVAIINRTMANRFWPGKEPLGKPFRVRSQDGPLLEVVGVVQDGKYQTVAEDPQPYFYVPFAQSYSSQRVLQIRYLVSPEGLIAEVQREIRAIDPAVDLLDARTMKESLAGAKGFFIFQFGAFLAAAMGILGLMLAVVGVYGVVSYSATQRTHEIGIRRALGASPADIFKLVMGQGVRLVMGGVFLGLFGAWVLTRLMTHLLLGISTADARTYASAAALLAGVTLFACWIPTRRAMRVDPMVALRYE